MGSLPNSSSGACRLGTNDERQELVERKVGLIKMLAFREDGGLSSQRPPSRDLEWSRSFIGTQEVAEQRKGRVSHVIPYDIRENISGCLVCLVMVRS